MKTFNELWEECERVDRNFDRCLERLQLEVYKNPAYIRACTACDVAYAALVEAEEK